MFNNRFNCSVLLIIPSLPEVVREPSKPENGVFLKYFACFCLCVVENQELGACVAAFPSATPPSKLPATGRCLFQACPIISSSLVTFRNLIITSTISSAGVKVRANARSNDGPPPPLRCRPAGCCGIRPAPASLTLFRSEYFYGFSADVRRAWAFW